MILEVFSSLNVSMILFYDSKQICCNSHCYSLRRGSCGVQAKEAEEGWDGAFCSLPGLPH